MDYQNAEFYRLNKKKGASTLIFNFVDETVTYKKEEGKNGKIRIVEYRKKHNEKGMQRRVLHAREMSVEDFDKWREHLRMDALKQRQHDDTTSRDNVCIESLLETDLVGTESFEEEEIRKEEELKKFRDHQQQVKMAKEILDGLTEKQRHRYIQHKAYNKTQEVIAEEEGCSHQMVSKSIKQAERNIDEEKKKRGL